MLEGKNNRIKQLEIELADREDHYKREVTNLQRENEKYTSEKLSQQTQDHLNKMHNLEMELVGVRSQLQHEST